MKTCRKCGAVKDISEFDLHRENKDGHTNLCRECRKKEMARILDEKKRGVFVSRKGMPRLTDEERKRRKKELMAYHKQYRKDNAAIINANKKEYYASAKKEGIQIYGGKCSCCGEKTEEFLTLEHINGRIKIEGKKKKTGKKAWAELKGQGWPKQGYTVLCFNCNCATGAYGSCPHTWKEKRKK